MPRTSRASAAALAAALAVLLSACTTPDPDPSPSPSPTVEAARPTPTAHPVPSPEPGAEPVTDAAPDLGDVSAIVARPEALELVDRDGRVVEALDYFGSAQHAVEVLANVVGAEPSAEPFRGTSHTFPGTRYVWDDVLTIRVDDVPDAQRSEISLPLLRPSFAVVFDAQRIRGIALATATGAQVGASWAAASADLDPDLWTCYGGLAVESLEYVSDGAAGTQLIGVGISNRTERWDESPEVTRVDAPIPIAAGCA